MSTSSDEIETAIFKDEFLHRHSIENSEVVLSLGFYFPTKNSTSKDDLFSKFILNLKDTEADLKEKIPASPHKAWQISKIMEQRSKIIAWFAKIISNLFIETQELMFIAVPSSKKINTMHGPTMLAKEIAKNMRCICGNDYLLRNTSKKPVHEGGSRSESLQYITLSVIPEQIKGKIIVLVDDVITTGNSLQAAKELLLEAGAHRVICLTIGKTVSELAEFDVSFIKCIRTLNAIIREMKVPNIEIYNSATRSREPLAIRDIIANNLRLFIQWQQAQLPSREMMRPAILSSFPADRRTTRTLEDYSDDELIEKIFGKAPEVDANMIKEAKDRCLDLQEVFDMLGNDEEGERRLNYTAIQQDFARNMLEFGYDFINIGETDEPESDEKDVWQDETVVKPYKFKL